MIVWNGRVEDRGSERKNRTPQGAPFGERTIMGDDKNELGKRHRLDRRPADDRPEPNPQHAYRTAAGTNPPTLSPDEVEAAAGVEWFYWQEDGWLRLVPNVDTMTLHIKWKFTSGPCEGRYCYVQGYPSDAVHLYGFLRKKVEAARLDPGKATVDRYFARV